MGAPHSAPMCLDVRCPHRLQHALCVLCVLQAATVAEAVGETWHPLAYTKAADGFDQHDGSACTNGVAGAACALVGGVVKLKGCAQCSPNLRSCYDKPLQHFATLAAECMDAREGLYSLAPQTVDGPPTGAQISVDSGGRLTLVKAAPNAWNLRLDGLVIPHVAAWGWAFIVLLFLAGAMYVVGGAAYNHKAKQMPLTLAAIPHIERWRELRGLVTDGARFSWVQGRASYGWARGLEGYEAIADTGGKANTGDGKAPGGKRGTGTLHEQRDAAVHSSKQPIKVVAKPSVAAAEAGSRSSSGSDSDSDNIVE